MSRVTAQVHYGLYPHQRQVANELLSHLDPSRVEGVPSDGRRVVAHLPTGAGKTRVAAHVTSQLLNAGALDDNGLVIWLASTAELCEQAADELSRAWSHLGRWNAPVYRYWGDSDADLSAVSGGFLVASLSKLWGLARRDRQQLVKLSSIAAGVVFDEAHQAVAATYEIMVGALLWDSPPLLGLTATPGRTSDPSPEDLKLTDLFAGNKVTIDPRGHANPIAFLVAGGYLAAARFHQFEFDALISVVEDDADGDYGRNILDAIGSDDRRTSDVVSLVRQCLSRHRRVMVFCPSVANAEATGLALREQGVNAGVITAATAPEDRSTVIERFRTRSNEPMALLNYGVLTAGFDAPVTSCVVVARPTLSVVLYSQMVGRGLRGKRVGGNDTCDIWTVVDTKLPGFRSVADAFQNWEELWS